MRTAYEQKRESAIKSLLVIGRQFSGNNWVATLPIMVAHQYMLDDAPFSFLTQLRIREGIKNFQEKVIVYFQPFGD